MWKGYVYCALTTCCVLPFKWETCSTGPHGHVACQHLISSKLSISTLFGNPIWLSLWCHGPQNTANVSPTAHGPEVATISQLPANGSQIADTLEGYFLWSFVDQCQWALKSTGANFCGFLLREIGPPGQACLVPKQLSAKSPILCFISNSFFCRNHVSQ